MVETIVKYQFIRHLSSKYKDTSLINEKPIGHDDLLNRFPIYNLEKTFSDEETFVKNFANPLFGVLRESCLIVVEEKGQNISLKCFYGTKLRRVGKTWFKESKNMEFLTVNKISGDVYSGSLLNYNKKRICTKKLRRNYFPSFPLTSLLTKIKNLLSYHSHNNSEIISDVVNKFLQRFSDSSFQLNMNDRLFKFYLDKKGFKYPNNFPVYATHIWGKEFRKILKKNDYRLVDSFMIHNKLKGKKLKKYLHLVDSLNLQFYNSAVSVFGEDWINQDENLLSALLNYKEGFTYLQNPVEMTKGELKKVFSCFKLCVQNLNINYFTFSDHISLYNQLKNYEGELSPKWMSDGIDYKKFHSEHLDWTERLQHYRLGIYNRIFPQYFLDSIEKEIYGYFPKILCSSKDYNDESLIQSNCVKGYIGRVSSFIISLRKGNIESSERATLEYRIHYLKNSEQLHVDRVQSLGKFNTHLDDSWSNVLFKLDEIVLSCVKDKRFELSKIEKICQNGTRFFSESHFNDDGILIWSSKKLKEEIIW